MEGDRLGLLAPPTYLNPLHRVWLLFTKPPGLPWLWPATRITSLLVSNGPKVRLFSSCDPESEPAAMLDYDATLERIASTDDVQYVPKSLSNQVCRLTVLRTQWAQLRDIIKYKIEQVGNHQVIFGDSLHMLRRVEYYILPRRCRKTRQVGGPAAVLPSAVHNWRIEASTISSSSACGSQSRSVSQKSLDQRGSQRVQRELICAARWIRWVGHTSLLPGAFALTLEPVFLSQYNGSLIYVFALENITDPSGNTSEQSKKPSM